MIKYKKFKKGVDKFMLKNRGVLESVAKKEVESR